MVAEAGQNAASVHARALRSEGLEGSALSMIAHRKCHSSTAGNTMHQPSTSRSGRRESLQTRGFCCYPLVQRASLATVFSSLETSTTKSACPTLYVIVVGRVRRRDPKRPRRRVRPRRDTSGRASAFAPKFKAQWAGGFCALQTLAQSAAHIGPVPACHRLRICDVRGPIRAQRRRCLRRHV